MTVWYVGEQQNIYVPTVDIQNTSSQIWEDQVPNQNYKGEHSNSDRKKMTTHLGFKVSADSAETNDDFKRYLIKEGEREQIIYQTSLNWSWSIYGEKTKFN